MVILVFVAGRATTNEELEDMLESGNPAIFTQGVSNLIPVMLVKMAEIHFNFRKC